jgi:DNA-binding transcriptional regulator LsrR (DeoR family)
MRERTAAEMRSPQGARLEHAARAAWLYYVGGRTQDEVAGQLNISRQAAQRLISLALSEKLIKFRFDHPVGPCMEAGEALARRFGLTVCEVVPTMGSPAATLASVAIAGAQFVERWLAQRAPLVLGLGTGRTLRAIANELSPVAAPQHKIFSLCGTILPMGRAIALDPVIRLAERAGAQCYSLPSPVIAATVAEREMLQKQQPYTTVRHLIGEARCMLVGIGAVGWRQALHNDGVVSDSELTQLIEDGAVGEITGWSYNARGELLQNGINDRVAGLWPLALKSGALRVGAAFGAQKVPAIQGALAGGMVSGLITDEATAEALLSAEGA